MNYKIYVDLECLLVKCDTCTNNPNKSYTVNNTQHIHDHYTGIYRGAAHSICNLRYSTQRDIPVVIHNGSNYDFHWIIKELAEEFRTEIQCIPKDKEKYKSFSIPIMYKECNNYKMSFNLIYLIY